MKTSIARRPMQVATFMRKEVVDVVRQPRLLLTMVIGPFLIMAAFGIGYRDTPTLMRTVFVAPPGSPFLDQIETYAAEVGEYVDYVGTSTDPEAAHRMLLDGDADLIVTFPDDPLGSVLRSERAPITVTHTRLDPIERTAIIFASRLSVDRINAQVLASIVGEGQEAATTVTESPALRELLGAADTDLTQLAAIDAEVIVRPFQSDVNLAVDHVRHVTDWYAPAAIVLMLQQFGVAFGALTFVRERQLGITDVFRVAPVGPGAALVGKYLGHLLIGCAIGAALTALVVATLDVPLAGSYVDVAIVMALTLFGSIGLGFVISLLSSTDAMAVQYTMITLLASLFFSGFFLNLAQLGEVARAIGWALPVTYGMQMLRDVMLRGADIDSRLVAGLAGYGAVMFAIGMVGAGRRMRTASV